MGRGDGKAGRREEYRNNLEIGGRIGKALEEWEREAIRKGQE